MQEVAAVHRELSQPLPAVDLSDSLQQRLLSLPKPIETADAGPGNGTAASPVCSGESPDVKPKDDQSETPQSPINGKPQSATAPVPLPAVLPPAPPKNEPPQQVVQTVSGEIEVASRRRRQEIRQRQFVWGAIIGAASLIALVATVVWLQQKGDTDSSTPNGNQIAAPPEYDSIEDPSEPRRNVTPAPDQDNPDQGDPSNVDPAPDSVDANDPMQPSGSDPSDASDNRKPPKTDAGPSAPGTDPKRPSPIRRRPPAYPALALDWSQVEGLIIARRAPNDPWQGAQSDQLSVDANEYASLPGSWAKADAGRMGAMVVDGDTRFTVNSDSNSGAAIQMHRGRVAFTGANEEVDYDFVVGQHTVSVHAQKSASFAFVQSQTGPQVWVRRGQVDVKGVSVRKGQRSRWDGNGFLKAEPVNQGNTWFDRPPRNAVRLASNVQENLLTSANVHADLVRLSSEGDANTRRIAQSWNVVIDPQRYFYAALSSADFAVRQQTCLWLISQSPRELDRRVWRSFASQSGDIVKTRHFVNWNKLRWERLSLSVADAKQRRMPQVEASQFVQGLANNDAAIRQLSIFFLEAEFGSKVKYNAAAPAANQRRAMQTWTQFLRREYSGSAVRGNPSQRPNANQRNQNQRNPNQRGGTGARANGGQRNAAQPPANNGGNKASDSR